MNSFFDGWKMSFRITHTENVQQIFKFIYFVKNIEIFIAFVIYNCGDKAFLAN